MILNFFTLQQNDFPGDKLVSYSKAIKALHLQPSALRSPLSALSPLPFALRSLPSALNLFNQPQN